MHVKEQIVVELRGSEVVTIFEDSDLALLKRRSCRAAACRGRYCYCRLLPDVFVPPAGVPDGVVPPAGVVDMF